MVKINKIALKVNLNEIELEYNKPIFETRTCLYNKIIDKQAIAQGIIHNIFSFNETSQASEKNLNLVSNNNKLYVLLSNSFFHFISDTISKIIIILNLYPDIEIIFDTANLESINNYEYITYFINILEQNNIKFKIINSCDYDSLIINNFSILQFNTLVSDAPLIYNFFKQCIKEKNIKPYRNVYISRKKTDEKYKRIDDHVAVEKIFLDLGYEIVYSEDFKTLEEQINYFYTVKTLASISGSGLTNIVFMQPEQTIIEIFTPLIIMVEDNKTIEELHFFYHALSLGKNHKYFSFNNLNKKNNTLKETIYNDKNLLKLLKNEQ